MGNVYSITIMDNYSRAILWGDITTRQDLPSFLSVLYRAVEHYGSPEALVTDSGSVFLANRAKDIYAALNVEKHEIEKGKPYQNYSEAQFGVQKRMADHHFGEAASWQELVAVHDRWIEDYNLQRHFAHEQREDGRRSPVEVLSFLTGIRYHPEDLQRAFFSTRYVRVLDPLGYARLMYWRVYGEEALAKREAALWLDEENLTVEYQGETLSRYEIALQTGTGKLDEVGSSQLFETAHRSPQLRLFRPLGDPVAESSAGQRLRAPQTISAAGAAGGPVSLCRSPLAMSSEIDSSNMGSASPQDGPVER